MDKLQMAHEYMLWIIKLDGYKHRDVKSGVSMAWEYADAMQSEMDKRTVEGVPEALQEAWQPDWSQAPEWAKWWVKESAGSYWWLQTRPVKEKDYWLHKNKNSKSMFAPSFDYTGNWQDSLRKRP